MARSCHWCVGLISLPCHSPPALYFFPLPALYVFLYLGQCFIYFFPPMQLFLSLPGVYFFVSLGQCFRYFFPSSHPFLYFPRPMFYIFLSSQPSISLFP